MSAVRLIAHRGVPARAPENSAASFALALAEGALAVELDLRPARDAHLVVLHDASPRALTGERRPASELAAMELCALRYLDDPRERLLLLDEALALMAGRVELDLELKPDPAVPDIELVRRLLDALARAGSPSGVLVSSESLDLLTLLREHAPLLPRAIVHRFTSRRDAVDAAREVEAFAIAASARRVDGGLVARAADAGLEIWAYTINDPVEAARLLDLGVSGIFTDDLPRLRQELGGRVAGPPCPPDREPGRPSEALILALDLGSTSTKAALVDPSRGVVDAERAPTPVSRRGSGRVEHDPQELLAVVRGLLEVLASRHPRTPKAAAIASQRSTGLWAEPGSLAPLGPAPSWRDRRGEDAVAGLVALRAELEREAGLEISPAWTVFSAGLEGRSQEGLLLPLGSWIAAALTGAAPRVDPTLANRMFLLRASSDDWSERLLETFALRREQLPRLAPSVGDHGEFPWPGQGSVPLRCLIGDQQAAYIGAAGPLGTRLVLNLGTAGFVMRSATSREPAPPGGRRAPLWSSVRCKPSTRTLLELPVIADEGDPGVGAAGADARRLAARRLALGDEQLEGFIARLSAAISTLASQRERTVLLCGGALDALQLVQRLRESSPLPPLLAREPELTLLGAARLAAAGSGIAWRVPDAGGIEEDRTLWL